MKPFHYKIHKLQTDSQLPYSLLLLADETIEAIDNYISDSEVYILYKEEITTPIAVFALHKNSDYEVEIKNIAVAKEEQSKGIGSYLLDEIKKIAQKSKYKQLIVGTGDCNFGQLHFYEKNGFIKYATRKDFFIENYPEPIIENGIRLRDMILLKHEL